MKNNFAFWRSSAVKYFRFFKLGKKAWPRFYW